MTADTPTQARTDVDNDIAPRLRPIFETPSEWFQEPGDQYETVFGPFAAISHLTPEMVRFRAAVRRDQFPNIDRSRPGQGELVDVLGNEIDETEAHGVDGRAQVDDVYEQAAIDADTPVVWIDRGQTMLTIHEQVRFGEDRRVTTPEELQTELEAIMHNTPDWEEIFDVAGDVAVEMGLLETTEQSHNQVSGSQQPTEETQHRTGGPQ